MSSLADLKELILRESVQFGEFTLASGQTSRIYIDIRKSSLHSEGAYLIGQCFWERIQSLCPEAKGVGGLTLGADPLVSATAISAHLDGKRFASIIVRKEAKAHGTQRQIEAPGFINPPDQVVAVDDVVTSGGSTLQAIRALREAGFQVKYALAVVDRNAGAKELLADHNVELHSLFSLDDLCK